MNEYGVQDPVLRNLHLHRTSSREASRSARDPRHCVWYMFHMESEPVSRKGHIALHTWHLERPSQISDMRFAVVGTSGAGKSTFARALATAAGCPHVELDTLYWGPDWTSVPTEAFEASVRATTTEDRSEADGNYAVIREQLWSRATHIVWLNYGGATVFHRVVARTIRGLFFRTRLWHGNRDTFRTTFFSKDSILLWAITRFRGNRRTFAALRQDPKYAQLTWVEITGTADARAVRKSQLRTAESPLPVPGA